MPGIWNAEQIAAWKQVVDAVHAKGCYIYAQLISVGRVADPGLLEREGKWPVISSSSTPFAPQGPDSSRPHALTKDEIASTISKFAQAAKNAVFEAGFDGVEVHGANGYLVDQFTQDVCNRRTDEYGGNVVNRARFAIEVAHALVDAVGHDKVGFRLSPFSTFQSMKMKEPIEQFAYLIRKLKGLKLAYLHLVESRVVNNVDCEKEEGLEPFLDIWGRVSPVLVAGGFTPESAKHAVDVEYTSNDVAVVFGRHYIANPDLPFRMRHGLELNKYDRSKFYTPEQVEGYLDCPFSEKYVQERHQSKQ